MNGSSTFEAYDGEAYDRRRRRPISRGRARRSIQRRIPTRSTFRRRPMSPVSNANVQTPRGPVPLEFDRPVVPQDDYQQDMQQIESTMDRILARNNALQDDFQEQDRMVANSIRENRIASNRERTAFNKLREEQRTQTTLNTLIQFAILKVTMEYQQKELEIPPPPDVGEQTVENWLKLPQAHAMRNELTRRKLLAEEEKKGL